MNGPPAQHHHTDPQPGEQTAPWLTHWEQATPEQLTEIPAEDVIAVVGSIPSHISLRVIRRPVAELQQMRIADCVIAEIAELHERVCEHANLRPLHTATVLRAETQSRRVRFVGGGSSSSMLGCDEVDAIVHAAEHGYRTCGEPDRRGRCWLPVDHRGDCCGDLWLWRLLYGQPDDDPAVTVVCSTCTPHQHVPRPDTCTHGRKK